MQALDTQQDQRITNLESTVSNLAVQVTITDDGAGNVTIAAQGAGETPTPSTVAVTGVSFASNSGSYEVGNTFVLSPVISPSNATNKNGTWAISNSSVVSRSGSTFTAMAAGDATISFTTTDGGFTASYSLTVTAASVTPTTVAVTGVSFASSSGSYEVGNTFTLTPTITPSDATNKNGSWTISDSSVVSRSGTTFTALAAGTATITFTTTDGGYTATYNLTVTAASVTPSTGSNNLLNPASEALGWTRSAGEGKYLKVNDEGVGGLGANANYYYCGCYDISSAHLSGKKIVCNAMIRTLALTAGPLSSSYRKDASQTIAILTSSSSSLSVGSELQLPAFDETVYTHLSITTAYSKDILNLFDGTQPLYISTKTPYSASDVDEYSA